MKKQLIAILSALLISGSAFALCSCSGGGNGGENTTPPTETEQPDKEPNKDPNENPENNLKKFTGIKLENSTVTYDGQSHSLAISGALPDGAAVKYSDNNNATDAGEYPITATLSGEGYEELKLSAKLTINKAPIQGLTFEGATATYDKQEHKVELVGKLPEGATVTYSCKEDATVQNSAIDAGVYTITATVNHKNYQYTGEAKLTINKAPISGLKFEDKTYQFDNTMHSVELIGVLPEGATVTYTCKENSSIANSAKETGTYTITATLNHKNYYFMAEAKLTIKAEEKDRHIFSHDNKLYFGNALDGDKLYSYSTVDGLERVSYDVPQNFTVMGGDLYFRSYSILGSSIKKVGATTSGDDKAESVIAAKGEYLCSDGSFLYFAHNALTQAKSGIYKVNLSGEEPTAQLLSEGKAKYLTCYGGKIYFADGANGDKLSSISVSGGARTVVVDEKITCLEKSGSALYYTVNNLLGDFIQKYDLATGKTRKLTSDAGANLTVIGSKLYYINVDLLNSYLYGKGIYCVDANPAADNSKSGTKLIGNDTTTYSSLTSVDGRLAYYRVNDQMLCTNSINANDEKEILAGFVAPEVVPISTGSKTLAYGKYIYFMDLYNGKALYSYDTVTKTLMRITSNKVADFAILGDTLYYNAVSFGVNNDLYKVNLKEGGEAELVSKNDCNDIVTDGTNIYYVEKNAGGVRTAIHKIDANGTDTIMYSKGAEYLTYYEGYVYFLDDNKVQRMPVNGYTVDKPENVTTNKDISHIDKFVIDNGVIYFRELYGIGWGFKRLARMNIDGSNYQVMMTKGTDPLDFIVQDGKVYYFNDVASGAGVYSISITAADDKEQPKLILSTQSKYYARSLTIIDGKIYFISYRLNIVGDSHLYAVSIANGTVEKIA